MKKLLAWIVLGVVIGVASTLWWQRLHQSNYLNAVALGADPAGLRDNTELFNEPTFQMKPIYFPPGHYLGNPTVTGNVNWKGEPHPHSLWGKSIFMAFDTNKPILTIGMPSSPSPTNEAHFESLCFECTPWWKPTK